MNQNINMVSDEVSQACPTCAGSLDVKDSYFYCGDCMYYLCHVDSYKNILGKRFKHMWRPVSEFQTHRDSIFRKAAEENIYWYNVLVILVLILSSVATLAR